VRAVASEQRTTTESLCASGLELWDTRATAIWSKVGCLALSVE